jgi:PKD repeat protein
VRNNNSLLFSSQPAISNTGTLAFTPAADANGVATVTVQVQNNGGTANGGVDTSAPQTFTMTVLPVNQPPSFTKGADVTVLENCGQQTISNWATNFSPGPANESGQSILGYIISNNNNTLFSVQPAISNTGTLAFTPATDANGVATVTVQVQDNGGTANGGVDTSAPQMFTITVLHVDQPPVASDQDITTFDDQPVTITLQASDVDGLPLTYTVLNTPLNGSLSAITDQNTVVYTPSAGQTGTFSFNFRANDGQLNSNIATVAIKVSEGVVPTLTSLSQTSAIINGAAFTLTVQGTNFATNAVVTWNGLALPTTYVSNVQLSASVATAQLAVPGQVSVSVLNQAPGGGTSNSQPFYVYSGNTSGVWIVLNTLDDGAGSLRQALNCARNGDMIQFDPTVFALVNSNAATLINILSELPPLSSGNVTIDAQDLRVAINGSGAGSANGLVITSAGNQIMGLTILSFTRSGVCIQGGAQNNIIGGDRNSGQGPNGQGLRIADCGTYGVEITDAGTDGNVVEGCWIGLDVSGTVAEPNLAGVLIQNGASNNTIGSTGDGEANTISGNFFEGVTIAGVGTNGNLVVANQIGVAANNGTSLAAQVKSRSLSGGSLGNGGAGVFLSLGTQNSVIGGEGAGQGNIIACNGGNGIEVHSTDSTCNTANANSITQNIAGGIALFDGSNDGVQPPVFTSVVVGQSATSQDVGARDLYRSDVTGTTTGDGVVEVYSDPGEQGETFLGSVAVQDGQWTLTVDAAMDQNITATFTDSSGNTSQFAVYGYPPAGNNTPPPTNTQPSFSAAPAANLNMALVGQAVAFTALATTPDSAPVTYTWNFGDNSQTVTGVNPSYTYAAPGIYTITVIASNGTASTAAQIIVAVNCTAPSGPAVFSIAKAALKLNFAFTNMDMLALSGTIPVKAGFSPANATVNVVIGSLNKTVTLNSKGKGGNKNCSFNLAGLSSKTQQAQFAFAATDISLLPLLLELGFADTNASKAPIAMPVFLSLNGSCYLDTVTMLYTAKKSKGGTAQAQK